MNKRKKYGLRQVLLKKGQGIATSKVSQERVERKPKHYIDTELKRSQSIIYLKVNIIHLYT